MKNSAKLLAGAFAALAAATSFADEGTREIEIAEIRVQRRDRVEYAWGEQNDVHELTYAVNGDGTASLFVGTEDGTRLVTDPDSVRVVKPYRLEPEDYVVYPVQPSDASQPVIQVGDNSFSLWNYISGSTTNYSGKPGVTGATRTIKVRSLNDAVRVCHVSFDIRSLRQTVVGTASANTTYVYPDDGEFAVEHSIEFHNGYMNMNDSPASAAVTNFVVYGYAGDTRNTTLDCSISDITVKEQDGREYKLGQVHRMIESIHYVQDRWAAYPACANVNVNDKTIFLDHDGFAIIRSDGALGGQIGSDTGAIISWDRGNSQGGHLIKGFEVNTNDTVSVYVTTKFGGALTVQAASAVNGTYADVATTNGGIVDFNGGKAYKLTAACVSPNQGFYKVKATISNEDLRAASITMHAATYFEFGGKTYAPVVNGTKLEFVEQ